MARWNPTPLPVAVLMLALLQGCAGVQVQRAKDLSSAAVRYSDATVVVIDVATDAAINADTQAQLRATRPATTEEARARRTQELEQLNKGLVETVSLYRSLRASVRTVKAYFVALQDLAEGSQAEGTEAAVKSLGERVNGLSAALEGSSAAGKPPWPARSPSRCTAPRWRPRCGATPPSSARPWRCRKRC